MSEFPERWASTTLGELNSFESRTIDPSEKPDLEYELYSVPAFPSGRPEFVRGAAIGSTKQIVLPNDVLVCKINPRINRVWRVGASTGRLQIASSEWIGVRAPGFDPRFLRYYFSSPFFRPLIEEGVTGVGGSLTRAQPKRVAKLPVPVVPLSEQGRIADKLDFCLTRVRACRERLDRVPQLLKGFREAVLEAAVSGTLTGEWRERHQAPNWQCVPLGELLIDGPQNGLYKSKSAYGSGTHILRIDSFYDGEVTDWTGLKRLKIGRQEVEDYGLKAGDLVINRVNSPPYVGKSALIRTVHEPCVFESNVMRLRVDTTRIDPEYCMRFLCSPTGLALLRRNVKHAVNQSSINQRDVQVVQVALPSMDEQLQIVRCIGSLLTQAAQAHSLYERACARTEQLAPAVLWRAFRGQLVPQDPMDEPADKMLARVRESAEGLGCDYRPRARRRVSAS